jgi:hypothetical protein
MNKRILFAVMSAGLLIGQAQAHQLAYSKAEQVSVNVPGEANSWCQPAVEMTLERPTWDSREPLDRLLSKIPFVLSQECASAKFTWKAVDAQGKLFASGQGTAQNLGMVNLAEPAAPVEPTAPVVAQTTSSPVEPEQPHPQALTTLVGDIPVTEKAAVEQPATETEPQALKELVGDVQKAPVAVAQEMLAAEELGRKVLIDNGRYLAVDDQNGCKWMMNGQEVKLSPELYRIKSEGATCDNGYARGVFKSIQLVDQNGRSGYGLKNGYVHPSGVIMSADVGRYVDIMPLVFMKADASQVVFEVGSLAEPAIKVNLAYQRNNNGSALYPYKNAPYFVGVTDEESFAFDAAQAEAVAMKIRELGLSVYQGGNNQRSLFITKNLPALYPLGYGRSGSDHMVFKAYIDESGMRMERNFALERKQRREREELGRLEMEAETHSRILGDYQRAVEAQERSGKLEADYVAEQRRFINHVPSPIDLMNPKKSSHLGVLVANVSGKEGDYYITSYPGKIRLNSDVDLEQGWQLIGVVNTTFLDKGDGKLITPTFKVLPTATEVKACKQEKCADRLTVASMVAEIWKRGSNVELDWDTWTPEVSKAVIERFEELKAARQNQ